MNLSFDLLPEEDELIEYVWNGVEYCLALIQIELCAFRHKQKID